MKCTCGFIKIVNSIVDKFYSILNVYGSAVLPDEAIDLLSENPCTCAQPTFKSWSESIRKGPNQ